MKETNETRIKECDKLIEALDEFALSFPSSFINRRATEITAEIKAYSETAKSNLNPLNLN